MAETPSTLSDLFPHSAAIDRAAPAMESRLPWPEVPAKCALYLLAAEMNNEQSSISNPQPLLLATVGNLRAALQRRLTDAPPDIHTKRIPYAQVCTRVYWRIVHSPFAANWWYWKAARTLFPQTYRELIPFRPAWWIALDAAEPFPEFRRTQSLADSSLTYLGPIRDKTSAGKLIDTLEDLFDLCRYHDILRQAPHGKPCAYKEMGKCPAPCDGSVPMTWYHEQLHHTLAFLSGESRIAWRAAQTSAMKAAASQLQFEQAAKIKSRLARADLIDHEAFSHLQPLENFAFLALQPGQGKPFVEPWLIRGGHGGVVIEALPQIKRKDLPAAAEPLLERCKKLASTPIRPPLDTPAIEQIAILAHHLYRGPDDAGLYLRLHELTTIEPLLAAIDQIMHHKKASKPLQEQASDKTPAEAEAPTSEPQPAPSETV